MVFSRVFVLYLILTIIPLQIKPEFVVKELEACCHHQINLKCKNYEKIAIIQSRYVVAKSMKHTLSGGISRTIPVESMTTTTNQTVTTQILPDYLSLWDLDLKFSNTLGHPRVPNNDYFNLNTPNWSKQRQFIINRGGHRYTTPNPLLNGLKFTAPRILEMPSYEKEEILDKETVWTQPLFPILHDENTVTNSNRRISGSVSTMSGRVPTVRHVGGSFINSVDPLPCLSYETLDKSDEFESSQSPRKIQSSKPQWHYKDLRPVFNRRCSGRSECTVNLLRNKLRDQDLTNVCHKWPDGRILVKYLCFSIFSGDVHTKCNEDVESAREGFILNPGYPEIYQGDIPCQWRLRISEPQQKFLLLFLDISLRGEEKSRCVDRIVVSEERTKLLSTCGDHSTAIGILSYTNRVNVTFNPQSRFAFPKRGFLLYFRTLGCGIPTQPANSYLIFRNGSHALFICEPGYVFRDTFLRSRWSACNSWDHSWTNAIHHDCQETGLNLSMSDPRDKIPWPSTTRPNSQILIDFVFPITLIVILCILNTCVVIWIQRKKALITGEIQNNINQELEGEIRTQTPEESTFTLSSEGIGHSLSESGERPRPWTFSQNNPNQSQLHREGQGCRSYQNFDFVDSESRIHSNSSSSGNIRKIVYALDITNDSPLAQNMSPLYPNTLSHFSLLPRSTAV